MATRYATKTGNWSDVSVWDGGTTFPGAADTVVANGYTVTIDQDITVTEIRTLASTPAASGGGFATSGVTRVLTCNVLSGTACLTNTTTNTTISGNITCGGSGTALSNTGTGNIVITGNVSTAYTAYPIVNSSTGNMVVTGNVTTSGPGGHGINNTGTGTVTVTGNVSTSSSGSGIYNGITGNITVTGNVSTSSSGSGVYSITACQIYVTGNVTATGSGPGISSTHASSFVSVNGDQIGNVSGGGVGTSAVMAPKQAYPAAANYRITVAEAGATPGTFSGNTAYLYGATRGPFGHPAIANVRSGTVYGPTNELTGTCAVPAAGSVATGVPVDNTVGTAPITAAAFRAALGMASANLDAQFTTMNATIASAIAGSGARVVTITVTDGATALEGARVRVTLGAETYIQSTNASGVVVFALDDGTWSVTVTKALYSFTPTTLVVNGAEALTCAMTAESIAVSSVDLVTGYVYCYSSEGVVKSGTVLTLEVSAAPSTSGYALENTQRTATSSAAGLAQFTNLMKGVSYILRWGTGSSVSVTVPTTATSPYAMASIVGRD